MIGVGFVEMFLVVLLGGLFGVPLSVPPGEPDPYLSRIAPAEPIYYTQWSGVEMPEGAIADQQNGTLRLLMEPEVRAFVEKADTLFLTFIEQMTNASDENQRIAGPLFSMIGRQMLYRPTCGWVTDVELAEQGLTGEVVLMVNVSDQRKQIETLLEAFVTQILPAEYGAQVEPMELNGSTYHRIVANPAMPSVIVGFVGDYLFIGAGDQSLESMLERGEQDPPAWLTQMQTDLAVDRPATIAYLDVTRVREGVEPFLGFVPELADMVESLGIENIQTYRCITGLHGDGYAIRTHVATDGELKALEFFSPAPITEDDLRRVPANTPAAISMKLDVLALAELLSPLVGVPFQDAAPQLSDEMSRTLGVDLDQLFNEVLGDTVTIYAAPEDGGLISGWVAIVPVIEPMQAQLVLENAFELLEEQSGGQVKPQMIEVDGVTMYLLEMMPEAPFRFAVAVTETELVASVLPQAAMAHIRRAQSQESLADDPLIASAYTADDMQGGGLRLVLRVDHAEVIQLVYPFFAAFGASALDELEFPESVPVTMADFPSVGALTRHTKPSTIILFRDETGYRWEVRQTIPTGDMIAVLPALAMGYIPAISTAQQAAGRQASMNNLRQIALALHNFHDTYGGLPARASINDRGKELLSWRVYILPYIEQQALYEQFHLDEPWDSEHNRALIPLMPATFAKPGVDPASGMTNYLGNATERGIFTKAERAGQMPTGLGFQNVLDGLSNTVMVVEVNDENQVIWTQPSDFDGLGMDTLARLIGNWKQGFLAGFGDGSVQSLRNDLDEDTLRRLFTRDDGEAIGPDINSR